MDAPSWTPDWEPFFPQPMMGDAFINLQDADWPKGDGMFGLARTDSLGNAPDNPNDMRIHFHNLNQRNPLELALADDVPAFTQAYNPQQLAELPDSQLEDIAQNVAKAIESRKQKILENSPGHVTERPSRHTAKEKRHHADQISKSATRRFECEHPGCTVTFRRKKDRTRHFRHTHGSPPSFKCPIDDCPLGTGHEMSRIDKFKDHLNSNAASSRTWRCVLPGCSETAIGRVALIHHIWRHDGDARCENKQLLVDYGLLNLRSPGYSTLQFICARDGCPFGTNSLEVIEKHRTIPHNGPTCPCPIPSCQLMFKNWEETSAHLAKGHSLSIRRLHKYDIHSQNFMTWKTSFCCPLCHSTSQNPSLKEFRDHCLSHSFEDLLANAQAVIEAYRFSYDDVPIWPIGNLGFCIEKPSNSYIFAHLALSDGDLNGIYSVADLDRVCSERGIDGL